MGRYNQVKEKGGRSLEPIEWARKAVAVAEERQASDIVLLDLRGIATFADYFVILTTESRRQMERVCEEIDQALSNEGVRSHHREGKSDGGWILLDYGDLIVHVFSPEEREYYQLERVWSKGTALVRIQ